MPRLHRFIFCVAAEFAVTTLQWEDDANRHGGKITFKLRKGASNVIWENLVLALIGETMAGSEDICGAVLSLRFHDDTFSLWHRSGDDEAAVEKLRCVSLLLGRSLLLAAVLGCATPTHCSAVLTGLLPQTAAFSLLLSCCCCLAAAVRAHAFASAARSHSVHPSLPSSLPHSPSLSHSLQHVAGGCAERPSSPGGSVRRIGRCRDWRWLWAAAPRPRAPPQGEAGCRCRWLLVFVCICRCGRRLRC